MSYAHGIQHLKGRQVTPMHSSGCQMIQQQPQGLLWLGVKGYVVSRQAPGQSWTSPPGKPAQNLPTLTRGLVR